MTMPVFYVGSEAMGVLGIITNYIWIDKNELRNVVDKMCLMLIKRIFN